MESGDRRILSVTVAVEGGIRLRQASHSSSCHPLPRPWIRGHSRSRNSLGVHAMNLISTAIDRLPGVHRIENCSKDEMVSLSMEMTHAVYSHDEVYGQYCSLQDYVDCPPEKAFEYLADVYTLQEWTYSLRDFTPMDESGMVIATDRIGSATKIYTRAVSNREAMTVDYH